MKRAIPRLRIPAAEKTPETAVPAAEARNAAAVISVVKTAVCRKDAGTVHGSILKSALTAKSAIQLPEDAKTPNIETCGSCQQNSIYFPVEQRYVSAVCSTTTDNCPAINQGATNPPSRCYECRAGELLCSPTASTEGCSAAAVINMKECIPSGKRCDANQNCCSGFACIEGYCY